MRVLVIEDDQSVRETLGMVLEAYGHKADLVENGEQALGYLQYRWPDVMLLDLTMPGMSGEEVFESISSRFGRVPPTVVVSAAYGGELRARRMRGSWFLAKPYTLEELCDLINEAGAQERTVA